MKQIDSKLDTKLFLSAGIVSLLVNFIIFSYIGRWYRMTEAVFVIGLPAYMSISMASIGILMRGILRGNIRDAFIPMGIEDARALLLKDNKFFRRLLTRLYLLIYAPMFLLGGWAIGGVLAVFFFAKFFKK